MKKEEAYSILGINPNVSEEEAKKKYRELSRKYHPDVCKDPGADDKFKKINEAFTRIKNQDFEQEMPQGFHPGGFDGFSGFSGFNGPLEDIIFNMGGFGRRTNSKRRDQSPIQLKVSLSFKESIFGCKKDLSFKRDIMCNDCSGAGSKPDANACAACGGKGKTVSRRGNTFISTACNKCYGNVKAIPCNKCNSNGSIKSDTNISVTIPGGVVSGNILNLSGIGNFIGSGTFGEAYSDVHVHIEAEKNNNFVINNNDLLSTLNISLLDSLEGCTKIVETLDGEKEIIIPKLSKHRDTIELPNLGVNKVGNQVVILDVSYPNNIDNLIKALKE